MVQSNEVENEIKNTFFEIFPELNDNNFDWKKQQSGYEDWDSFAQMQLITSIESKFNLKLDIDDVISITSAEDVLNYIKSHT